MIVQRATIPADMPFDLGEVAMRVRLDDADQVTEAGRVAAMAAAEIEHHAQVALLTQTVRVVLPGWPASLIFPPPIAPVVEGTTVTVTADGESFVGFDLIAGLRPMLRLFDNPTEAHQAARIVIEYEAGFGDAAEDIPPDLRHAILDQAEALYAERRAHDHRTHALSPHTARIAARYRRDGQ